MTEVINTNETLADAVDVAAADGPEAETHTEGDAPKSTLKDVLAGVLGKTFKDDESALKAVKDTFAYVGKVGKFAPVISRLQSKFGGEDKVLKFMEETINKQEAPVAEVKAEVKETPADLSALNERLFYNENPEYKPYKDLIKSMGADPEKVVGTETFKSTYTQLKAASEVQNAKSVLHSNPRLGQVTDAMTKARESLAAGDHSSARKSAVSAVLEAYEK